MIEPKHPVRPAFDAARDRAAYLEARLSEEQRAQYAEFVKKQKKEKEEQEKKAARAKAEYDQAKEKAPHLVKNYDPPIKIKDPYLRRMALDAQAEHNKVITLERTQFEDKIRFLEKLDREREEKAAFQDNAQHTTRSRASPDFARAAAPERQAEASKDFNRAAASTGKDSALSRAFDKARAQQEQTRQRTQDQERSRHRERGRD